MDPILAGVETEFGLMVDGRDASDQIEDAVGFVRSYDGPGFRGWDYCYESPRADLRGFAVDRLAIDPQDAVFDRKPPASISDNVRSDVVLPNGARFYNDHGHPEYSTPECWSLAELALHEKAGEYFVAHLAARAKERGTPVRVYKNNTDYHGASYGTHESYLVPRWLGFERIYKAVSPMLIARQVLCGAGKVGSESGPRCRFQLSQRADFLVEPFNAETLYRRPIFNSRDEPHARAQDWIRLHVISGDSNMMASATARKVGLVKLALALAMVDDAPTWRILDPVRAFHAVSRDESGEYRIDLEGHSWTTAQDVIESYLGAAEVRLGLWPTHRHGTAEAELVELIAECRTLLTQSHEDPEQFARHVDWAAKRRMLEGYMAAEDLDWNAPNLPSLDLEYHNVDPEEGLFHALQQAGEVEMDPLPQELTARLRGTQEPTRARARGLAVSRFHENLATVCWRSVTFDVNGQSIEVELDPTLRYPAQLAHASNVESFIQMLRGTQ